MYLEYWGLTEKPFRNTSDPRFLCLSEQHDEALTRLKYCVHNHNACAMLTGVFGSGKTLLAQALLDSLPNDQYVKAFIFNPQLSATELLYEVIYQLGIRDQAPASKTEALHRLSDILNDNYAEGRHTVIVVDEAHLIEDRMIFEELRLLLNFQKKDTFLLTLILLGQPELREKITHLKPFDQRISIRFHLKGLKEDETRAYIAHRLQIAGADREIFEDGAMHAVHESTGGIPRRINQICDLALLSGFGMKAPSITSAIIREVVMDPQML
jgi:general secretion pathway protein A